MLPAFQAVAQAAGSGLLEIQARPKAVSGERSGLAWPGFFLAWLGLASGLWPELAHHYSEGSKEDQHPTLLHLLHPCPICIRKDIPALDSQLLGGDVHHPSGTQYVKWWQRMTRNPKCGKQRESWNHSTLLTNVLQRYWFSAGATSCMGSA